MIGVFAEFERSMIVERVKAGLKRARAEGKVLGRPRVSGAVEAKVVALRKQGCGMAEDMMPTRRRLVRIVEGVGIGRLRPSPLGFTQGSVCQACCQVPRGQSCQRCDPRKEIGWIATLLFRGCSTY